MIMVIVTSFLRIGRLSSTRYGGNTHGGCLRCTFEKFTPIHRFYWCRKEDLNLRLIAYEATALPTELFRRVTIIKE